MIRNNICCSSTTPFGLILGPDSPSMDEFCGGALRFLGHCSSLSTNYKSLMRCVQYDIPSRGVMR